MERLTQLEAINTMLTGIQLMPVAALDDLDTYSEAQIAISTLRRKTLEVLTQGWNFNTSRLALVPESPSGTITVPPNTIDVYSLPCSRIQYGINQNRKLINLDTRETVFSGTQDVIVVFGYPWEDLPVALQMLCLHEARLAFKLEMEGVLSSDATPIHMDIQSAKATMRLWDSRQKRSNMLDSVGMGRHLVSHRIRG